MCFSLPFSCNLGIRDCLDSILGRPSQTPAPPSHGQDSPDNCGEPSDVTYQDGVWTIRDVGTFSNKEHYSFEKTAMLPEGLNASGPYAVNDMASGCPYDHAFSPALVFIADNMLCLEVPGGQSESPIQCAEVTTSRRDIFHASVRTNVIFSDEPGVCHGITQSCTDL